MTQRDFALKMLFVAAVFCAGATAANADGSNAAGGITAHLDSENILSHFGPVGFVSHANNGAYDKSIQVAKVDQHAPLATGTLPPYFFMKASGLSAEVKGSGIAVDAVYTQSRASVDHASLIINIDPPSGMAIPIPYPALWVQGSGFVSQANFNTIAVGPTSATGSSSMRSLKISGTLLNTPLSYSGEAAPNTVIYDSPNMTVTLNKQQEEGTISCSPDCAFTPTSIEVTAVDIRLNKAQIDGHTISGTIALGRTKAE